MELAGPARFFICDTVLGTRRYIRLRDTVISGHIHVLSSRYRMTHGGSPFRLGLTAWSQARVLLVKNVYISPLKGLIVLYNFNFWCAPLSLPTLSPFTVLFFARPSTVSVAFSVNSAHDRKNLTYLHLTGVRRHDFAASVVVFLTF